MSSIGAAVERHHRPIILSLLGVIVVFLFACTFHNVLPICHWVFNCDHLMHL